MTTATPFGPRVAALAKAASAQTAERAGVAQMGEAMAAAELGEARVVGKSVTVANAEAAAQGVQVVAVEATEAEMATMEATAMGAAPTGI